MILFVESDRLELDPPELLPLRPGVLDDVAAAEAASTTWLVVTILLKVLLPLTEMMVVTTAWVTLLCGAVVVVAPPFDDAPDVAGCELKAKDDCVSVLNMKDVDCAWFDENATLLGAANDKAVVWADAAKGLDTTPVCEALPKDEGEADAIAEVEAPVLKGTLFCRYRRRPSISSPAQSLVKSSGRRMAHGPE